MGNHELKHVLSFDGLIKPSLSQVITRSHFVEADYAQVIDKMRGLPLFVETENFIVTHGYLQPDVRMADQRTEVLLGRRAGEKYLEANYAQPWYKLWNGKPVIVGHRNHRKDGLPSVYNNRVFCIDTGCCYGGSGRLTGLRLPEFAFISVPSRANHWSITIRCYHDQNLEAKSLEMLTWQDLEKLIAKLEKAKSTVESEKNRLDELLALWKNAITALVHFYGQLMGAHAKLLAQVREDCAFDSLSPREQANTYGVRISGSPLAKLLHQARKGTLSVEIVRKQFSRPAELLEFISRANVKNAFAGSSDQEALRCGVTVNNNELDK